MDELQLILLLTSVLLASVFPSVQDTPNNGILLYNSSETNCPKSLCSFESLEYNESCILSNNSAALGRVILDSRWGVICHNPSPAHTVAWLHPNGSTVMAGNAYRVFVDMTCTNELRRNGVFTGSMYNGIYTCTASESGSNATEVLFIIGIYERYPPLTVDNLTVDALISPDPILILNCSSRGLPATTVRWFFDNQLINITVGERTQTIADRVNTVYHSVLTIQKQDIIAGRLRSNGQYTCEVDAGVANRNISTSFNIIPNTPMQPEIIDDVISWPTVFGHLPTQYQVEFQGGHCSTREMVSVNDTSLALDNLQSTTVSQEIQLNRGANYSVQVRAVNPFGSGEWSDSAHLYTEPSKPSGPPEGVVGLPMTTSVLVTWDEVNCLKRNGIITHYSVRSQGSGSTQLMNKTVDKSLRQTNLTGLESGRQYWVSVSAVNEAGEGPAYTFNITTSAVDNESQTILYIACGGILGLLLLSVLLACCCFTMCKLHRRKATHTTNSTCVLNMELPEEILTEIEIAKGAATNEPIIHDFPSDLEACEGEYVLLYVTVTGNPPPTLTWYHNSEGINTDTSIEVGANGTLSIPSMEEKHVGTYRLVASNCYGSCFEEMQLGLEDEDTFVLRRAESIASMIDNSPVPVSSFEEYVSLHHCKNNEAFHFQFVCLNTYSDMPSTAGSAAENRILNRFKNILPYDQNRIILNPVANSHDYQNDYINASYIDGYTPCKFIATQGPLPHTVVDFWRLVWQESTSVIVMLCDIVEAHRVKCQQYWPETGSHTYGPVTVQKLHEVVLPMGYVIRKFEVSTASGPSLKVTHYQFKNWPEHSVPSYAGELLSLIERIGAPDSITEGAILVHCSTGVGRTGVFIALDTALCQAREDERVDVIGVINNMRCQRMKMVQTLAQFVFIHDAVLECLVCGHTQIPVTDFRMAWNRMSRVDKDTGRTDLENQYRVLKKITPKASEVDTKVAQQHPKLNRFKDHLPRDQRRVILDGTEPGHDYINASFVDGYKQKKSFIITQGPLEGTCSDFWQMIYQYQCSTIVMLSDFSEYKQEVCFQYWPKEGEMRCGYYSVQLLGESKVTKDVTAREFCLSNRERRGVQEVIQFQVQNWTPDGLSADYSSIANLIQNILTVQRKTGNKPIVVHCSDTVSRSAIFCAAVNAIERFKADNIVDIYQIVKCLRLQKTQAIMSVEQYSAIFSIVMAYSDGIDDKYDNFKQHRAQAGGGKAKEETSPLSEEEDEF